MRPHNLRYLTRLYSAKASAEVEPLAGTVPPHSLYVVLRTPKPIRTLESRPISPLRLDLQRSLLTHGGLVNLGHISDERAWARSERLCSTQLTSHGSEPEEDGFDDEPEEGQDEERYDAVAFAPDRPPLHLRGITAANVTERADTTRLVQRDLPPLRRFAPGEYDGPVHIYVCTHGERDCRCGEHGSGLADALMAEVKRRRRERKGEGWDRVVVGEVAHVGGHKHAANALVFPHGEWLGELRAEHAPTVLDAIAAQPFSNAEGLTRLPLLPEHWRGRMGMSMDEQRTFISQHLTRSY
ncbi:hypothetical protein PENSPDRAFT_578384 [Peniophora sp. CONT]|nr:hypothetical protein PENSPDRAFT_578384 [Peniophora sp. CONT]